MKFVFPVAISPPRPYRGLARIVHLRWVRRHYGRRVTRAQLKKLLPVPFGWMMMRVPQIDGVIIGPWWVLCWNYAGMRLADAIFWLSDFGVFVGPEDGYLHEFHLTWPWRWHMRRRSRAT